MSSSLGAVIFDLDGTLIDSLADIAAAANRMLVGRALSPHPVARYPEFIGEGARNLVERALGAAGSDTTEAWVDGALADFRRAYEGALVVETRAYPGIPELLAALRARGVPMAILSNKPDPWTKAITAALFPNTPFVEVRGQRVGAPRKPDPTAALALAEALHRDPRDIAFVGDSRIDMQTARAAGMRPVAVAWGFGPLAELQATQCEGVFATVAALRAHLGCA